MLQHQVPIQIQVPLLVMAVLAYKVMFMSMDLYTVILQLLVLGFSFQMVNHMEEHMATPM